MEDKRRKKLEEVKLNLKATIQSTQKCLFLHEIPHEYESLTFTKLPYIELGYNSPEQLFRAMPDVVYIKETTQGRFLLNVADPKTAHLDKLVAGQKDNSTSFKWKNRITKSALNAMPERTPKSNTGLLPIPCQMFQSFEAFSRAASSSHQPLTAQNVDLFNRRGVPLLPTPPNEKPKLQLGSHSINAVLKVDVPTLLNIMRNIGRDNPRGLSIFDLLQILIKQYNIYLKHTDYSFCTWSDFFRSYPWNTVFQYCLGNYLYPVNIVPKQNGKSPTKEENVNKSHNVEFKNKENVTKLEGGDARLKLKSTPCSTVGVDNENQLPNASHSFQAATKEFVSPQEKTEKLLNAKMMENMRTIMDKHPDGLIMTNLIKEYKNLTNHDLCYTEYGCSSYLELVERLSNIVNVEEVTKGTFVLYPLNASVETKQRSLDEMTNKSLHQEHGRDNSRYVSNDLLEKMLNVTSLSGRKLYLKDFIKVFEKFYGERFETDLDHNPNITIETIFQELNKYFALDYQALEHIVIDITTKGKKWLSERKAIKRPRDATENPTTMPSDVVTDDRVFFDGDIPEDVINSGNVSVKIVFVIGPGKFFFQLSDTVDTFKTLMDNMKTLYDDPQLSWMYTCSTDALKPGLPCVAYFDVDKSWNRATIDTIGDNSVDVTYVDYGNSATLPISQLRFLRKEFMSLPVFGLEARLHDVKGTDKGAWTREAAERFQNLCSEETFLAEIKNSEEPYSIFLRDTSQGREIDIGQLLIEENLGQLRNANTPESASSSRPVSTGVRSVTRSTSPLTIPAEESQVSLKLLSDDVRLSSSSSSEEESQCSQPNRPLSNQRLDQEKTDGDSPNACRQICSPGKQHQIGWLPCDNHQIHIVRTGGIKYFVSFEVSSLLSKHDVIKSMGKTMCKTTESLSVRPASHPLLFEDLQRMCESPPDDEIELIPISEMENILKKILLRDQHIVQEVVNLVDILS